VQGGYETALMVPTEVLAEQHFLAASALLSALEVPDERRLLKRRAVRVELLTARATERERSAILRALAQGEVDIVVGTHALLTDDVQFSSLGVVVIDEQHRFGVDQRAALRAKGAMDAVGTHDPDLLVMTATPIPRTAAMTVYGDLDYSVLDELPSGRTPVRTRWVATDAEHESMWTAIRAELRAGRQVYVVCPLVRAGEAPEGIDASDLEIDEDEEFARDDDLEPKPEGRLFAEAEATLAHRAPAGAVETAERLAQAELAGARIGLLHGQMPSRDKESVMSAFRSGEISVLVATTVIEVGVDVANATVMLVVDADRFGIAQLHQLRGRVGRGQYTSACFLSTGAIGDDARSRIEALVRTGDGFELAEIDLDLRGEGTVLGVRQKGRNDLKLASLRRDRVLVQRAREVAQSLLDDDPRLEHNPVLESEVRHFVGGESADYLFRS
jgi:ATP-dependent DNA helicase RecG